MSLPAESAAIAKRVNNWGRWGAADEIGTLNLITDAVVRGCAAARPSAAADASPWPCPLQQDSAETGAIQGRVNPGAR